MCANGELPVDGWADVEAVPAQWECAHGLATGDALTHAGSFGLQLAEGVARIGGRIARSNIVPTMITTMALVFMPLLDKIRDICRGT
jgi:hypothetical protein